MRCKMLVVAERDLDSIDPTEPAIVVRVANPEVLRLLRLGSRHYVELVSATDHDAPDASASASPRK
jgi:hypothetical protein